MISIPFYTCQREKANAESDQVAEHDARRRYLHRMFKGIQSSSPFAQSH